MDKQFIIDKILNWKVYANVDSVSSSWMSRCISFYISHWDRIVNITEDIHNLKWYWKLTKNWNLRVWWCWMDMIFATLYYSMDYEIAKDRNQQYSFLPHN